MTDDVRVTSFRDTGLNDDLQSCADSLRRIAEALEKLTSDEFIFGTRDV